MNITSYYPVLAVESPKEVAMFFVEYFDFNVLYESDWYYHLAHKQHSEVNLALLQYNHPSVPQSAQVITQGVILNFEFADVDSEYQRLQQHKLNIVYDLTDEDWGQRHFIIHGPANIHIDCIKVINPSEEFQKNYVQ